MVQIHGTIGSLSELLSEFRGNNIDFITSTDDITAFLSEYDGKIAQIAEDSKQQVIQEKKELSVKLIHAKNKYEILLKEREDALIFEKEKITKKLETIEINSSGIFDKIFIFFEKYPLKNRLKVLEYNFSEEAQRPLRTIKNGISRLLNGQADYENNFNYYLSKKIDQNSLLYTRAKTIIDNNKNTYYGAIGEQKALSELQKLPDSFHVINNFKYHFSQALHRKSQDEWINSVQIDHLVIGPTGVYIIETKNWSNASIQRLDLFSPVEQVKRTSYALFVLLNRNISLFSSALRNHWGTRKINVNNIILMIGSKPDQEFQFVKVLSLYEISYYLQKLKTIYNSDEVNELVQIAQRLSS